MKTLVVGWFSFEEMGATAGDLLARDVACEWLAEAGYLYNVALAPPFAGGVDWRTVDSRDYAQVVFVCGPFHDFDLVREFLQQFSGCRLVGLDLSMIEPLDRWNPFDVLLERDSSVAARPELAFLARQPRVPVVGVCLARRQKEYNKKGLHRLANAAIERLVAAREMSAVPIDTRLDTVNRVGLRTPGEVEALIAKMDVLLTTRLHGLVLALKNAVPVIAIDPIAGGGRSAGRRRPSAGPWYSPLTPSRTRHCRKPSCIAWARRPAKRPKSAVSGPSGSC